MTKSTYTAIVAIIDRSGSMDSISSEAESAITALVEEQKALPGELTIDTVFFDHEYEERAVFVNPAEEKLDLAIRPRGMTALYDAVGRKISSFGSALEKLAEEERPGKVLFIIVTDGAENNSKEYSLKQVASMIKTQTDEFDWSFTFIGANQDAVLTAKELNISSDAAISFAANEKGVANVINAVSGYTTSYRGGKAAAYSDESRAASMVSQ